MVSSSALPSLSDEQRSIVDAVRDGHCVAVTSAAGSGKTTTLLHAAKAVAPRRTLLVLYNRDLCDDVKSRIRGLGLDSLVSCYTIHSLLTSVSGTTCHTDRSLHDAVVRLERDPRDSSPSSALAFDVLMIDEVQDLSRLLYRAVSAVIAIAKPTELQIVVCGDLKQRLYGYRSGDMCATGEYLREAPTHFGSFTARAWRCLQMRTSFRLTPNVAAVVNAFWGTQIVPGNMGAPNPRVEYWVKNQYLGPADTSLDIRSLEALIAEYGQSNVMFLVNSTQATSVGSSTARKPIMVIENALLQMTRPDGTPRYRIFVSGDEVADAACARGKLRIMTFCASKGTEARCVVVFGADVFNPEMMTSRNQMGVALSRARERLIIVHGGRYDLGLRRFAPGAYYPAPPPPDDHGDEDTNVFAEDERLFLQRGRRMREVLQDLVDRGVLTVYHTGLTPDAVLPVGRYRPNPDQVFALAVTDRDNASPEQFEVLLAAGDWTLHSAGEASKTIEYESRVSTTRDESVGPEDVSSLYGTALGYALQFQAVGYCPDVEACLCSLVLGTRKTSKTIAYGEFLSALKQHGIEPLSAAQRELVRAAFHDERGDEWAGHMPLQQCVDLVNRRIELRKRHVSVANRTVRVFAITSARFKQDLKHHIDDIVYAYELVTRAYAKARDEALPAPHADCAHLLVYLANATSAFFSFHYRFMQIGTRSDSYADWVDADAVVAGVRNVDAAFALVGGEFEARLDAPLDPPYDCIGGTVVSIIGRADWLAADDTSSVAEDDDIFELKFVTELNDDHRLQLLLYAAMRALDLARPASGVLFNARTCERESVRVTPEMAKRVIDVAARMKKQPKHHSQGVMEDLFRKLRRSATSAPSSEDDEDDRCQRFRDFENEVRKRRDALRRARAAEEGEDEEFAAAMDNGVFDMYEDPEDAPPLMDVALIEEEEEDGGAGAEYGGGGAEDGGGGAEDGQAEEAESAGHVAVTPEAFFDLGRAGARAEPYDESAARRAQVYSTLDAAAKPIAMVIDTETTGLAGYVIQLGWVLVDVAGTALRSYERLFRLPPGGRIEPGAQAVHHISEADLRRDGAADVRAELEDLKAFIDDMRARGVAIVAHNAAFDAARLNHTAAAWDVPGGVVVRYPDMTCTMVLGRRTGRFVNAATGKPKRPSNTDLYMELVGRAPEGTLHTALADCMLTAASYVAGVRLGLW